MSWKIAPIGRGGDLLYSQAGTPSLDLRFAEKKALTDYVSGANLVTFSRASSATYVGSDGLIKTATTNAPRFDHDPTTGESLGLLVEESRSNLLLNSETLSTQNVTVTAVAHTLSFTGTGTITLSGTSTTGPLVGTGTGEANRVSLTFTPTAGTLTLTVSGTVTNAQLEIGAFQTSYIPTTGATATRAADVASISGSNFSSWYRQDEGSNLIVFTEPVARTDIRTPRSINDGTTLNRIDGFLATNYNHRLVVSGTSFTASSVTYAISPNSNAHIQAAKAGSAIACLNGVLTTEVAPTSMPVVNRFNIGRDSADGTPFTGHISRLTYWPQRLPDATLQTITT